MPILDYNRGDIIGRVEDVCYCPGDRQIGGLTYHKTGFMSRRGYLPLGCLRSMSGTVVLARDVPEGMPDRLPRSGPKSVFRSDGRYLGELVSLMLDEVSGTVKAAVISTSLVDDMRRGLIWMEQPQRMAARADHILLLDQ